MDTGGAGSGRPWPARPGRRRRPRPRATRCLGGLLTWSGAVLGGGSALVTAVGVATGGAPVVIGAGLLLGLVAGAVLVGSGLAVRAGWLVGRMAAFAIGLVIALSAPMQDLWPARRTTGVITDAEGYIVGAHHVRVWTPNGGTVVTAVGVLVMTLAVLAQVAERRGTHRERPHPGRTSAIPFDPLAPAG